MSEAEKERVERWIAALQIQSTEKPTDDEGFIVLTLVSEQGTKEFVTTESLKQLLNRGTKYIEFFTTDQQGKKLGVSLEWVGRDIAWKNLTDEQLHEARNKTINMVKNNPDLFGGNQDGAR